jgi:hypothetical protein
MRSFFAFFLISLALPTFAANDKGGNGGDAVVCPGKVILLDFHEMKRRNFILDLPGKTLGEKVESSLNRLSRLDPFSAGILRRFAKELVTGIEVSGLGLPAPTLYFTDDELTDIPDSLEVSLPKDCVKEQLVIQQEPKFPEDPRYTISKKLWDQLDLDQRALTVLHESWYRLFILQGETNSVATRYMNGLFASGTATSLTLPRYIEIVGKNNFMYALPFQDTGIALHSIQPEGENFLFRSYPTNHGRFQFAGKYFDVERFGEVVLSAESKLVSLRVSSATVESKITGYAGSDFTCPRNIMEPVEFTFDDISLVKTTRVTANCGARSDVESFTLNGDGKIIEFEAVVQEIHVGETLIKRTGNNIFGIPKDGMRVQVILNNGKYTYKILK